jgi:L-fuculose-phosphate aldolase
MHPTVPHAALRRELVEIAHRLDARGLLVGLDGNLSARLPDGNVLCTRAGVAKGRLTEDDLVEVDPEGRWRAGWGRPTSEIAVHLACYAARPDVGAVVHAHPPAAIACTLAGIDLDRPILPEVVLTLGTVPTLPYVRTGTDALAEAVRAAILHRDALLLARHGAVTVAATPWTALHHLETVEHLARIALDVARVGGVPALPPDEAIALRRAGLRRYGGPPAALARIDEPTADLDLR